MKHALALDSTTKRPSSPQLGTSFARFQAGRAQPTLLVLKTTTDAKRQHVAIGKLVKMCKASPVVTNASRGITAEVRKDRDRGHD